jgi:hypothetical protein
MTMQAILDFARDHIETIICAVAGVCFGLAWTINQGAFRLSRDIDAKLREFRAEVDRERAYSAEVARLLETGIELMTPAQVEQWAGVREFLAAYSVRSAKGEDDDAGTEEPAREGRPGAILTQAEAQAAAIRHEMENFTPEERKERAARFRDQRSFTLRNANEDLTHPGYPPEYSLTSAEIAERLRVGIMDFEEPGDADAGFPDWTPKAQRPF